MRAARTMSMQMIGRRSIWSGGVRIFRARQKSSAQQPPDNGRTALRMQRCAASLFEFVAFSARARLFRETMTTRRMRQIARAPIRRARLFARLVSRDRNCLISSRGGTYIGCGVFRRRLFAVRGGNAGCFFCRGGGVNWV